MKTPVLFILMMFLCITLFSGFYSPQTNSNLQEITAVNQSGSLTPRNPEPRNKLRGNSQRELENKQVNNLNPGRRLPFNPYPLDFSYSLNAVSNLSDKNQININNITGISSTVKSGNINFPQDSLGDALSQRFFTGAAAGDNFGVSVANAGDVNGDGYDDIIVGANTADIGATVDVGRAYIFFGGLTLHTAPDVILPSSGSASDHFGYSVAGAGDVNGDGFDDVIIGARYYGATDAGRAYIYYGGSPMDNLVDLVLPGLAHDYDNMGYSVTGAGDLNGDGFADVAVGASGYDTVYTNAGRVYVYLGGSSMNNIPDVLLNGKGTDNWFGECVAFAGDVNGDGYDDLLVGADGSDVGGTDAGSAYLYFGGSTMNNVSDVTFTNSWANDYFGRSLASAGDVNGDGYGDIIIGAPNNDIGGTDAGVSALYLGSSSISGTINITSSFKGFKGAAGDLFGRSVSSSDINCDGYSDILIGAPNNSANGTNAGRAYVFFGGPNMDDVKDMILYGENAYDNFGTSVSTVGDCNGDGIEDIVIGAPGNDLNGSGAGRAYLYLNSLNGTDLQDEILTVAGQSSFGFSIASAGDVNGDGYDDIMVGRYTATPDAVGSVWIYYGGPNFDNVADKTITGVAGDQFGYNLSSAGDVNRDGYDDVIIGAQRYTSPYNFTGKAFIYFGAASMNTATPSITITGETAGDGFGGSVACAGDINADGFSDVMIGAGGYDTNNVGRVYVFKGGTGFLGNIAASSANVKITGASWGYPRYVRIGRNISGAGDVNGDGYEDMMYSTPNAYDSTGVVMILLGGSYGNRDLFYYDSDLYIENLPRRGDYFGDGIAKAGDINHDGFADIIVAAPNEYHNENWSGKAYVFFGGPSNLTPAGSLKVENEFAIAYYMTGAGDVNNDGFDDIICSSLYTFNSYLFFGGKTLDTIPDIKYQGHDQQQNIGMSLSSAGDINKDGYADVMMGYPDSVYVYLSSSPVIAPRISSVRDVPHDQGGKVTLNWLRSGYDDRSAGKITEYDVYRSLPPANKGFFWEKIATVPAAQLSRYSYTASTLYDSSGSSSGAVYFMVQAKTRNANEFWWSNILSGYSVDNLAPTSPINVIASTTPTTINLSWKKNTEPDLKKYRVYRNDTLISESYSNAFIDTIIQGKTQTRAPFIKEGDKVFDDKTNKSERLENNTRPVYSYTYEISAVDIHGNESVLSDPLNVNFAPFTKLTLTLIPEGFYNTTTGRLNSRDTITVYLRNAVSPYAIVDSAKAVLDSVTFTAEFDFKYAETGTYYYVIKHRNSLETWSKTGGEVFTRGNDASYNFTSANTQAYGNNLIQKNGLWCLVSGDINKDGSIDALDRSAAWNDRNKSGYYAADLNGDGVADALDRSICWNNRNRGVLKPL